MAVTPSFLDTASKVAEFLPVIATFAPAADNISATAAPMPELPPVMRTFASVKVIVFVVGVGVLECWSVGGLEFGSAG